MPGPPPQLISLDLEPSWREHAEALGLAFSVWDVTDGAGLLPASGWPRIDLAVISYVVYHHMSHDLFLPCISPFPAYISPGYVFYHYMSHDLYLPYISPISRLYLAYISPQVRLLPLHEPRALLQLARRGAAHRRGDPTPYPYP